MILVTGATGSIGRHLVRRLSQQGVAFRAMVRDEARGKELGCEITLADFDDPASLPAAMRGADRLFLNAGGAQPTAGEQPMVRQQKAAIDAAKQAGISHVVKVSVWHAHQGGRLAEGAHWEIEQYLKASGLHYSILQPSGFMQNFLTGAGTFTEDGKLIALYNDAPVSYIDCQDIADCAAALLTADQVEDNSYILTGPEALTHSDIIERLSATLGRPLESVAIPPSQLAEALKNQGLPATFADDVAALSADVANGSLSTTTTAVQDLTGHPARSLETFLKTNQEALQATL